MFFEREDFALSMLLAAGRSWNGIQVTVEPRQFSALTYRVSGSASFILDNGKRIFTHQGEILYLPAGVGYTADYTDNEILVFHFTEYGHPADAEVISGFDSVEVSSLFCEAVSKWTEKEPGYQISSAAVFYKLLSILYQSKNKNTENAESGYYRALARLEAECFNPDIKISNICRDSFISETAFRQLFSEQYGCSPISHLITLRLHRAALLLSSTDMSISEIALSCGFRDSKYFSRLIHKKLGSSPSEIRKKNYS